MNRLFVRKHLLMLSICLAFFCIKGLSQNSVKVNGIVKDRLDKAMPNVSVTVQGKPGTGVTTDAKGEFNITVSPNDVLVFSHVGFTDVTRQVSNTLVFEVIMDARQGSEEEVVVVGFGKAKKVSLVGAQSTVNVAELKQPVANVSTVLAGRVAAVQAVRPAVKQFRVWGQALARLHRKVRRRKSRRRTGAKF